MYAIRAKRGSLHRTNKLTRGCLHLSLRCGEKGTGRVVGRLTCLDTAEDYQARAWELARFAQREFGIDAGRILNLGPYRLGEGGMMPNSSLVRNLVTGAEVTYTLPPRAALLACFAQHVMGNANSWEYEERYGHLVRESTLCFSCGDWATFKDGREG